MKHSLHLGPDSMPGTGPSPHDFGGTAAGYFHEAHGVLAGKQKPIRRVESAIAAVPAKTLGLLDRAALAIKDRLG